MFTRFTISNQNGSKEFVSKTTDVKMSCGSKTEVPYNRNHAGLVKNALSYLGEEIYGSSLLSNCTECGKAHSEALARGHFPR